MSYEETKEKPTCLSKEAKDYLQFKKEQKLKRHKEKVELYLKMGYKTDSYCQDKIITVLKFKKRCQLCHFLYEVNFYEYLTICGVEILEGKYIHNKNNQTIFELHEAYND